MNILVFSDSAWDDTNSLGNTMSNFFSGNAWKNDNFSNIYLRNAKPNNKVCKKYYRMTIFDMVKHFFNKEKIGFEFDYENENKQIENTSKEKSEQKLINILHKYSIQPIYYFMDWIYRKEKWNNKKLKKYISDFKPDIVFSFLTNVSILNPFVEYIKKNTNAKVIVFIADDVYGQYTRRNALFRKKYLKDMENIINNSDIIYAISNELCEEYGKIYNKEIKLLYKGCKFNYPVKSEINSIIKFVYAGNLLYGRDKILAKIAKAIEKCNKNKPKAFLEIYTGTNINEDLEKSLNIENSSSIMGKRNYEEIKQIMNNAEYNLHVESFDCKNMEDVKYSFSTKIIDCLQSGSTCIGIGPSNISSIKYINKIPGAYVIEDLEKIEANIYELIENKDQILNNAKIIREYALEKHDIDKNQMKLRNDFERIQVKRKE